MKLRNLPENWTVGVLVPDQRGVFEAKGFGFPADNIAVWDATSAAGVVEAGETIKRATDNFMVARSQGVRGSRSIFSTGLDAVNSSTVHSSVNPFEAWTIRNVSSNRQTKQIRDAVEQYQPYRVGKAFYQLTKTEDIQAKKQVAVLEKSTGKVYTGPQARQLIGLPDQGGAGQATG
jgi:7-keto-8-aminopelargonate synthetase-like enzyme